MILYFILVRSVDFGKDQAVPHIAPASEVALLMLVIFALYLLWDILTKVLIFWKYRDKSKKSLRVNFDSSWWRTNGVRMLPSTACLFLSWITIRFVRSVDAPHMLTADLALIALILLFRALKDCSSSFPKLEPDGQLSPGEESAAKASSALGGHLLYRGAAWNSLVGKLLPIAHGISWENSTRVLRTRTFFRKLFQVNYGFP